MCFFHFCSLTPTHARTPVPPQTLQMAADLRLPQQMSAEAREAYVNQLVRWGSLIQFQKRVVLKGRGAKTIRNGGDEAAVCGRVCM